MSSSSSKVPSARRWRPKQYVLAGMAAVVAASAVVVVTSIVLHPARISFTVNDAMTMPVIKNKQLGDMEFSFILAVDNPSRSTAVRYTDVVVNLQIDRVKRVQRRVVQASVDDGVAMPFEQPPANLTKMQFRGVLGRELNSVYNSSDSAKMKIIVVALVRFRVGIAFSRLYDVRVFCWPINFFNYTYNAAKVVNCSASS